MDLTQYTQNLENVNNSSNLLEYAKINFQSKMGVITLSKKTENGDYINVDVPKNKRITLYVVDCTTSYIDKEGVTHPISIKSKEDKKDGFKIQFRDGNKIFDFYKDFGKLFIKKMLNQLLNCDLSKPVSFLFAFDKASQKPFLLIQQKNENGEIINIKGKYSKEEMPVAEPLVNKAGKPHLDTRGMPTFDYTEIFDFIKNKLIEELKVKIEVEKRTDWSEYSTPISDEPADIEDCVDYEVDADSIYGKLPLSHFED